MDKAARERLIVDHIDWATKIAGKIASQHSSRDPEEMIGEAIVALIESVDRYNPARGEFKTFARHRIRGKMLDRIRRNDPAGHYQRAMDRAGIETKQSHRGIPSRVDGDVSDLAEGMSAYRINLPSLPARQEDVVDARMKLERIRAIVEDLPKRHRTAYELYYFRDMDLKEVGRELGVTESRACQLMVESRMFITQRLLTG